MEHHEYLEFRYVELLVDGLPEQCVRSVTEDYSDSVTLSCSNGEEISNIEFGSWGTPGGECFGSGSANNFSVNDSCAYDGTVSVLTGFCVGRQNCTFTPSDAFFGGSDPCDKVPKWLAAAVTCAPSALAVGGSNIIQEGLLTDSNITAWQLTYPAVYVSDQLVTSSPELNAVWNLCQYTVVATALDVYTDSNTRQRSVICMEALTINLLMQVTSVSGFCCRANLIIATLYSLAVRDQYGESIAGTYPDLLP